jgi:hypothetical protein
MKFNFRQGIQHAPLTAGHPSFLTYNPGVNTVGISIGVDLVRVTAAYGDYNYIIEERENASESWGPFVWNTAWGPEPVGNYTLYLYWDINRATGIPSRGFTPRAPLFGEEPVSPAVDQHWFDTATNTMKVWDGSVWRKVIRVFAASFTTGTTTITEYDLGSQVGITTEIEDVNFWYDHGYILFGADQKGIRYNDTNFVTTATQVMTRHGSFSSPIRLELLNSTVLAAEPIPAFYAVSNTGTGTVQLANGTYVLKRPVGVTLHDVNPGDPVDIVTSGIIYNDQWNWDTSSGEKDIYCGATGELFQGPVTFTNGAARVGTILSPQTILVDIDLYAIGGGGPVDPVAPVQHTQIFKLTSLQDGYFNDQAVETWDLIEPGNGYVQPQFLTANQVYNGPTEFVVQEAGTYEVRCSVKSNCGWPGFPVTGMGDPNDDFVYRLVFNSSNTLTESETVHQRTPKRTFLGNDSFSWTDIFRFSGDVNDVVTIAAYIASYYNTSSFTSYTIDVAVERLG